jgi:hypothetical protein
MRLGAGGSVSLCTGLVGSTVRYRSSGTEHEGTGWRDRRWKTSKQGCGDAAGSEPRMQRRLGEENDGGGGGSGREGWVS